VYARVAPHLRRLEQEIPAPQYIGPVGVFAVLAAQWFAEEQVDWAVFETGRGARFDDVAELRHEGAVITSVLLEHVRELGPDLEHIAWHKLGILRPDTRWAILHDTPPLRAGLPSVDWPGRVTWDSAWGLEEVRTTPDGTRLTLDAQGRRHPARVPALGHFAADNARIALMAARAVLGKRFQWATATAALEAAHFPGRAERLWPSDGPPVILDGTVRRESAAALLAGLREAGLTRGRIAALADIADDKDWRGVADVVGRLAPVEFVVARNPRLHFPPDPAAGGRGLRSWPSFAEAWDDMRRRRPRPDLVLVLGTQSLVGDALDTLGMGDRLLDLHAREATSVDRDPPSG
jgi:dihydrofolate synthase/folylpolyglutamate synthase